MAVEERRQQNPTYGRAIPFRSGDVWNVLLAVQQIKTSNINVCRNWLSWTRAAGWNLGNQLRAKASHAMPQTCCGCEVGCLRGREGHQLTAVDSREEMYLIQTTKVTKATLCRGSMNHQKHFADLFSWKLDVVPHFPQSTLLTNATGCVARTAARWAKIECHPVQQHPPLRATSMHIITYIIHSVCVCAYIRISIIYTYVHVAWRVNLPGNNYFFGLRVIKFKQTLPSIPQNGIFTCNQVFCCRSCFTSSGFC